MATVRIYLDTRAAKGSAPLKLAVNHKSKSSYIPLGVKISPKQWEKASQRVINHPDGKRVNCTIQGWRNRAERVILGLADEGVLYSLSAEQIRDRVWSVLDPERHPGDSLFLPRMERFMNLKSRKNTRGVYGWTIKKLQDFDPEIRTRTFRDINTDYLNDLNAFYSGIGVNSRSILFRNIRAVFNDAIDAGITTEYPFRKFHIKNAPTRKKALTIPQLNLLARIDTREAEYRDMFMLMFYLRGINIGDLLAARKEQIVNGRFEYRRNKVGSLFSIKIEPEAQAILDRYEGKEHLLSPLDRYSDYKAYLHHLNAGLKRIGAGRGRNNKVISCGLFPELSSNWARHSWASAGAALDIPTETISRGMGHSSGLGVTNIYIDFPMKKVDIANRRIIDAVNDSGRTQNDR